MANENEVLTPEELKAEQDALKGKTEEEIKAEVIKDYGFDETTDAEKIEKLVKKEVESNKKLSAAIGQKIRHRTDAETLRKNPPKPANEDDKKTLTSEEVDKKVGAGVAAELKKRDLEALDYPEDLKKEIERVADISGVSVKKALSDPYIKAKIDLVEKDKEAEQAALRKTGGKGGGGKVSIDNIPDFDMSTAEGRKQYQEFKDKIKAQEK